jgi:hypothetical protein
MIRHTNSPSTELRIGIQRKNNSYTFLHWLEHSSSTSRFKYLKFKRALTEYKPIGPTILVEWEDE